MLLLYRESLILSFPSIELSSLFMGAFGIGMTVVKAPQFQNRDKIIGFLSLTEM